MVIILRETNIRETLEFTSGLASNLAGLIFSFSSLLIAGSFLLLWFIMVIIPRKFCAVGIIFLSMAGAAYITYYFATQNQGRTNHIIILRALQAWRSVIRSENKVKELLAKTRPLPYTETASTDCRARNVVLVIGESLNRESMSLYGYPIPTTPRLDSIARSGDSEKGELFIFTNAVASSSSTAGNIPRILSFMTDEPGQKEWYEYPTMLQLFSHLGYCSRWISNQERTGNWSNLAGILSEGAQEVIYVGASDSEDCLNYEYDDVLLPPFRKALFNNDSLRMICLHMMGSHTIYAKRYPRSRSRFTSAQVIEKAPRPWLTESKAATVAEYNNSVLFTDSVLTEFIKEIEACREPSVLVFLSDHGENVYDHSDYVGRDPKSVDVPLLVYANRAYLTDNNEIVDDLRKATCTQMSTSSIIHVLLHLTGTRYRFYNPMEDPLSVKFKPRPRYVDGEVYWRDED